MALCLALENVEPLQHICLVLTFSSLFIYTGHPAFAKEPVELLTQNLSGTAFKNK